MVALKGYFDDSGDDIDPQHRACAFGGYVTGSDKWPSFETAWAAALAEFEVPYLHMKEFGDPKGPYAKWKGQAGDAIKIAFFQRLCGVVQSASMFGFGATVRVGDLQRLKVETGANIDLQAFCIYLSVVEFALKFPEQAAEFVFDHFAKAHSKIALAQEYLRTDVYYPQMADASKRITMIPLSEKCTARDVPGIQAADYAAWELRKSSENKSEWFDTIKPSVAPEDWFLSLVRWRAEQTPGKEISFPRGVERGSLSTLFEAAPFEGTQWDYRGLKIVHEARGGVWPTLTS